MFTQDYWNSPEPLSIYLSRVDGSIIQCLDNYIEETSASLTIGLNQQYELSFDIYYNEAESAMLNDYLQEGMYLLVEKVGLFRMAQPTSTYNGAYDYKNITARSCDSELEDKNCSLSLNMGTEVSQEYLVVYDSNETELLLDPYTNLPYDWLVLYNTFPEQIDNLKSLYNAGHFGTPDAHGDITVTDQTLFEEIYGYTKTIPRIKSKLVPNGDDGYSLVEYVVINTNNDGEPISAVILNGFVSRLNELITFYNKYKDQLSILSIVLSETDGNWKVGNIYGISNGDYSLANSKFQFESDTNLYSFLTQSLAQASGCVVNFDILKRKVNVTPVEEIGDDTGISLAYDTLISSLDISATDDQLSTRLFVKGGNDLGIEQANFGLEWVDDLAYKLNARNESGERIYVSDALAEKYLNYVTAREAARPNYINLSKQYRKKLAEIKDIQYRVPNDVVKTDWSTFSLTELEEALVAYKNLLAALITMYKEDYTPAGLNNDGSVNENYMRTTMYWYDYFAYQNAIDEIECAIDVYPYYKDQEQWSQEDIDRYKDLITAWETEWSLYGIIELQAKIDTYKANMEILVENGSVIVSSNGTPQTWNNLTDAQKQEYGNNSLLYYYDQYLKYWNLYLSARDYLNNTLKPAKTQMEMDLKDIEDSRVGIVENVKLENNFTASELEIINRLYKDADYTNENILYTSISTTDEEIDAAYELLQDAQNQASIYSRPQLTFAVTSDNLLGLKEFEPYWNQFIPGNYMYVQYRDSEYLRLRMVGYEFNPMLPSRTDIVITFSNFIRSKAGVSDVESILGMSSGATGRNTAGSSGGGGGGTFGDSDNIDITISNTMLARMLNSEQFGTKVTNVILDTIDANSITAKRATFGSLANGTTTIDGDCIKTGAIKSNNYNGSNNSITNTAGSIIRLDDGKFNFGGGNLTWDGTTLSVSGTINTNSGSLGNFTINGGKLYSNGHSAYNTAVDGVYIGSDYISLGSGGVSWIRSNGRFQLGGSNGITYNGSKVSIGSSVEVPSARITGTISCSKLSGGTISGQTINGGTITGTNITAVGFKALGNDADTYCTIDDELYMVHRSVSSDARFIWLRELKDVVGGDNKYNSLQLYASKITFSQTDSTSATLSYTGSAELGTSAKFRVGSVLTVGTNANVTGDIYLGGSLYDSSNAIANLLVYVSPTSLRNLNNASKTCYTIYTNDDVPSTAPVQFGGCFINLHLSSNYCWQFFSRNNSDNGTLWFRKKQAGTFGSWKSVTFS